MRDDTWGTLSAASGLCLVLSVLKIEDLVKADAGLFGVVRRLLLHSVQETRHSEG